jgi:hypothetical protein
MLSASRSRRSHNSWLTVSRSSPPSITPLITHTYQLPWLTLGRTCVWPCAEQRSTCNWEVNFCRTLWPLQHRPTVSFFQIESTIFSETWRLLNFGQFNVEWNDGVVDAVSYGTNYLIALQKLYIFEWEDCERAKPWKTSIRMRPRIEPGVSRKRCRSANHYTMTLTFRLLSLC